MYDLNQEQETMFIKVLYGGNYKDLLYKHSVICLGTHVTEICTQVL